MQVKPGKHVIFLGAGASNLSGYPLANELRLLISSRQRWHDALVKYEAKHGLHGKISKLGLPFWDKHIQALTLFRNGGFATLDEFCLLAGHQFQAEIHGLRRLVRAALGLFNPEEKFEGSEYYGFVQALFKEDLINLRDDITVLTYNYDPYLEFLLTRALEHRRQIRRAGQPPFLMDKEAFSQLENHTNAIYSVTSGFASPNNLAWLENDKGQPSFCVLKLHGSLCFRVDTVAGYDALFSEAPLERATKLLQGNADSITPPILFPWEVMTDQGFVGNDSPLSQQFGSLYHLFRGIWERARREVQAADKISFVGLSLHRYLHEGLKYLFKEKAGEVEVCIANPDNTPFQRDRTETHWGNLPISPASNLAEILHIVAPAMNRVGHIRPKTRLPGEFTLVRNFDEFIKAQMEPIVKV